MPVYVRVLLYQKLLDTVKKILPYSWLIHPPRRGSFPFYAHRTIVLLYVLLLSHTARETRDVLTSLAERRLDAILRRAASAPYWRELDVSESCAPLLVLSKLALRARAHLRDVPREQLTTAETISSRHTLKWRRTSGTTGVPFSWGCDARTYHVDFPAYFFRMLAYYGYRWSPFSLAQICILNISDMPHNPLAPFAKTLQWLPFAKDSEQQLNNLLVTLSLLNNAVLLTYPTDLWLLVQELKKRNVRPHLAYVISTGQMLEEEIRAAAEEYFSCPVRSFYATREMYAVAMECREHTGTFHVNEENVVLEIVDAEGKETRDGEWGDVVLTSLYNTAMPLFRYSIGDSGKFVAKNCDCGTILRRIELQGRDIEFIAQGSGTIPAHEIGAVILRRFFNRISQYQIREEETGIRILVVPAHYSLTEEDCELLRTSASAQLGDAVSITIEQVDAIPRNGNKFERFVPLRSR